MTRRAAVKQADISRAVKVARKEGVHRVTIRVNGAEFVLDLDRPETPTATPTVAVKRRIAL
jgi:hypothetical protein